jgi:hypothetical protein
MPGQQENRSKEYRIEAREQNYGMSCKQETRRTEAKNIDSRRTEANNILTAGEEKQ